MVTTIRRVIQSVTKLDAAISDAEDKFGESDLRDALLKNAEFLAQIGEKDAAVEAVRKTNEKTIGLGNRMDLVFHNTRMGLFFTDNEIIKINIAKAHQREEIGAG